MPGNIFRATVLAVLFLIGTGAGAQEARTYVFGVLNQQSAIKTAERWNPILKLLSEATGHRFQLKMGPTVAETDEMMGRGEFDFVFTNHNFQKQYDGQHKVIARWAGKPIYSVIAVLSDSPIKDLKSLQGKKIGFPSASAFVAYAVPSAKLKESNISFVPVFAGNQEGALAQLRSQSVDAVAANSRFITRYAATTGLKYREIWVSDGYPELPVIANNKTPTDVVNKVKKALIEMSTNPSSKAILEAADCPGFEAANDQDYNKVRKVYRITGE